MNRKRDLLFNRPVMFSFPDEIFEIEKEETPSSDGFTSVFFNRVRLSERSKLQLNPDEVNLENLLKSGVLIDVSSFVNSLGYTEVSQLESSKSRLSESMLQYLMDNEDDIKEFVKSNNVN